MPEYRSAPGFARRLRWNEIWEAATGTARISRMRADAGESPSAALRISAVACYMRAYCGRFADDFAVSRSSLALAFLDSGSTYASTCGVTCRSRESHCTRRASPWRRGCARGETGCTRIAVYSAAVYSAAVYCAAVYRGQSRCISGPKRRHEDLESAVYPRQSRRQTHSTDMFSVRARLLRWLMLGFSKGVRLWSRE